LLAFIVRRVIVGVFVLLAATAIMYVLTVFSGDPLGDLYEDQSTNREQKIAARIEFLQLDVPVWRRYFLWLGGASKCALPFLGECDLGRTISGALVTESLGPAISTTLRLVLVATALAVVLGITVGIVSALRQYSGFDYSITFASFLFFSLPIFWVAVLLKQFGAIKFNDWLVEPTIAPLTVVLLSVAMGVLWMAIIGGDLTRRAVTFGVAAAGTAGVLSYLSAVEWFARPALGPGLIGLTSAGVAVGITALLTGLGNRRVLYATLAAAALGTVSSVALAAPLKDPAVGLLLGLGGLTVAVSAALGFFIGGAEHRATAVRATIVTGVAAGALVLLDRVLANFASYTRLRNGRPIPTTGESTPNFTGNLWQTTIDYGVHLLLPTIALILISFAVYTRYTRASMLEVLNQDYVRTARAKGLPERTVVLRHAFRNALIPLTTVVAFDFAAVIGGAVVTEKVFGWRGMGTFFIDGLLRTDPNPVMAFFVIVATAAVLFNLLADIVYAYLDPRIRVQ
jgi:peptide/nickel transport system permease protein